MTKSAKWMTMLLLCLSGSVVFWQPFFSETYYVPMQNAFGFSNTQIGILSSTFGYTPDIFAPAVAGIILDAYPGAAGFQIYFLFIGGLSFVGLMAAYSVYRKVQRGSAYSRT